MTDPQRVECTALNSLIYALVRVIYSVEEPFRQQSFHSYHTMVQFNINEEQKNRYSDYSWCKAKLNGILAKLDYRKAWGKTVGTNGLVLIEDGVIIGLGTDSALRTTALPYTHANVAVTPPGCREFLPVGLLNIEPVYADPNEPFAPFEKPDGRLPREVAADLLALNVKDDTEDLNSMTLFITASLILSPENRARLFKEIERLRELAISESG